MSLAPRYVIMLQSDVEDGSLTDKEHLERGLQRLGLRQDSHRSVLHLWARQLPAGMFDGHRSVMVAPDHLIFHGLTKRLVAATFKLLSVHQRRRVGVSLREALARRGYRTCMVYNGKRSSVLSLGISEWAATLTVFAAVVRRTLVTATPSADAHRIRLHRALEVIDSYTTLVNAAYFYPRVELDGVDECRNRTTPVQLQQKAEVFLSLVRASCLRPDMANFGLYLDVPNIHRLQELVKYVIPALLDVRHAQELLFENAHQPLKKALVTGNGHDDALRAMTRYCQAELVQRIALDLPSF